MESEEWVDKGAETAWGLSSTWTLAAHLVENSVCGHSLDTSSKAQSLLQHFSIFYHSLLHFFSHFFLISATATPLAALQP